MASGSIVARFGAVPDPSGTDPACRRQVRGSLVKCLVQPEGSGTGFGRAKAQAKEKWLRAVEGGA
jgi:hypothetical protein